MPKPRLKIYWGEYGIRSKNPTQEELKRELEYFEALETKNTRETPVRGPEVRLWKIKILKGLIINE